ncbi:MAG: DUF2079 domain-containing protein [Chlamydiae bacterium]|nr:DUF2079 domain-containing protein [Chlamydiota bacterium]
MMLDKERVILFLGITLYILTYFGICFLKYRSYSYHDFDLAHHAQTLSNMLQGSIETSILGIPFLGNHTHWILFLILPFYALWPSPLLLLFLQTLTLGLGAWPLYKIGKKWIHSSTGLIFAFAFLMYPALGYLNLFEFHPTSFALFFLLWTFWFFCNENLKLYSLFLGLSCLTQENLYFAAITLGLYGWRCHRSWKWIIPPLCLGIMGFMISLFWMIPHFNQGKVGFETLYSHLGSNWMDIFHNLFFKPGVFIHFMVQERNIHLLSQLLMPLCFLPLLSPVLLLALPFFLQHFLSSRSTEHTIYYHYTAEIIPFLFVAALDGMRKVFAFQIIKKKEIPILLFLGLWAFIVGCVTGPLLPTLFRTSDLKKDEIDEVRDALIQEVGNGSESVMATFDFLSHLSNHQNLYSFHHLYSGVYTLSHKNYEIPQGFQYLLMDSMDPLTFSVFDSPQATRRLRHFLESGTWKVKDVDENIVLFAKDDVDSFRLFQTFPDLSPKTEIGLRNSTQHLGALDLQKCSTGIFLCMPALPPSGTLSSGQSGSSSCVSVHAPISVLGLSIDQVLSLQSNSFPVLFDGKLECKKACILSPQVSEGGRIQLSFFWQAKAAIEKDYYLSVGLFNPTGKLIRQVFHPLCYRIYPTFDWKENERVIEYFSFVLPKWLSMGRYSLRFYLVDRSSGERAKIKFSRIRNRVRKGEVVLGNVSI